MSISASAPLHLTFPMIFLLLLYKWQQFSCCYQVNIEGNYVTHTKKLTHPSGRYWLVLVNHRSVFAYMSDKTIAVKSCQVCVLGHLEKALPLHSLSATKHYKYLFATH